MEWMILPYKRYADFSGRSRRMEYWMFNLFFYLVLISMAVVAFGLDAFAGGTVDGESSLMGNTFMVVAVLFVLGSIIPHIAVTVRRFHDQDKSGWMYLLNFIPYIGGFVIIVFMCMEGTRGENQYGADPMQDGVDTSVFS